MSATNKKHANVLEKLLSLNFVPTQLLIKAAAEDALTLDDLEADAATMRPYRPRRRRPKRVSPKERMRRIRYYKKNKVKIARQQKKYRRTHRMELQKHRQMAKRRHRAAASVDPFIESLMSDNF